jgi:hypothetical protein
MVPGFCIGYLDIFAGKEGPTNRFCDIYVLVIKFGRYGGFWV